MNTEKIKDFCNGIKLLCDVIEDKKANGFDSVSFETALKSLVSELNNIVSESEDK